MIACIVCKRIYRLDLIRKVHDKGLRATKVICTLGPACWSVDGLIALIDAGNYAFTFLVIISSSSYSDYNNILSVARNECSPL